MPQLVKGGKYVFGWSLINKDGEFVIPEEALGEYHIEHGERVILMPGSGTSGGFSIAKRDLLVKSRLGAVLLQTPELVEFRIEEGELITVEARILCWVTVHSNGRVLLLPQVLGAYGIKPRDSLLAVRGSYLGIGMAARGPLIAEARRHPEIVVFQA